MTAVPAAPTSGLDTQSGAGIPALMDALVLHGPGRFEVQPVAVPEPGTRDLLCRVDTVAICGTDPHIIAGDFPGFWPQAYPFTPGHEWSGTVVAAGAEAGAHGWAPGQRVAGTSHAGCGLCRACRTGRYNLCESYGDEARGHRQYGHYSPGACAQYVVQHVNSVFRLPDGLSLEAGALLDPASIALHTVKRAEPAPGDTVVVVGPGPIGLLAVLCAQAVGAGRVLVVGRGDRLAFAERLGAEPVDYTKEDPIQGVRRRTDGRGAPAVYECAGAGDTLRQAVLMAARGGRVVAVGIPTDEASASPLPWRRLVLDEVEVRGARANRNTCEEVLPLMTNGRVPTGRLITHRFPLHEYRVALDTFANRAAGALKVLVKPQPPGALDGTSGRSCGTPTARRAEQQPAPRPGRR